MIYIGNDIIEISRVKRISSIYEGHFFEKIFSKKEMEIIAKKDNNPIYLSGKFAAKEAAKKALLSSRLIKNISFKNIQILNHKDGSPYIDLFGFINEDIKNFQISISHTDIYATAFALLEI